MFSTHYLFSYLYWEDWSFTLPGSLGIIDCLKQSGGGLLHLVTAVLCKLFHAEPFREKSSPLPGGYGQYNICQNAKCHFSGLSEFWNIFRRSGWLRIHMPPVCLCWGMCSDHKFKGREILTLRHPLTTPVWRSETVNAHTLLWTGSHLWSSLRWNLAGEAIWDNNYNNIVVPGFQLIILMILTRNLAEIAQDPRTVPGKNGTELNIWKKSWDPNEHNKGDAMILSWRSIWENWLSHIGYIFPFSLAFIGWSDTDSNRKLFCISEMKVRVCNRYKGHWSTKPICK